MRFAVAPTSVTESVGTPKIPSFPQLIMRHARETNKATHITLEPTCFSVQQACAVSFSSPDPAVGLGLGAAVRVAHILARLLRDWEHLSSFSLGYKTHAPHFVRARRQQHTTNTEHSQPEALPCQRTKSARKTCASTSRKTFFEHM